ncbi:MAG: rhodanese-like domain-containing protein [Desulfobacterales bacterium]|jgi:rhodanese-related sulfurtransferase|nr:rhodanese-like domain-containing protein [Desulfobacterales bacterium]MDD3082823.1 rhodanese-like domain-containing protein [Desulfobacterales bacterium]MDD3951701.1 rhodanese-like domain-containing protein [Desulfobacterales bacterium]MDD4463087.1 rhodanese-like domain-containing protein [Desulfobacterales bacterium]
MNRSFSISVQQSLWQIPALIALAVIIALGVNHWRSDGIPLVGDWSMEARFSDAAGESLIIELAQARRLFEEDDGVLFVDARLKSEYAQEHISGALSLPWQDADRYFAETAGRLESRKTIVAYCDGEDCDLSHELALFLKDMGFENVRVLVNGLTVWRKAGLPIETGN